MKKGEERKQKLLKIAYRLFIEQGSENTSVDAIIEEAGIAKGTYYYYFESKEQMLAEVIGMMLDSELEKAKMIAHSDLPIPQRIVGIVASIRPQQEEMPISDAIHVPENVLMHNKVKEGIIERLVPVLSEVAEEGNREGIFDCDNIPERVRVILFLSFLFDEPGYTLRDVDVFIDTMEKILGAQKGTLDFVRTLISL